MIRFLILYLIFLSTFLLISLISQSAWEAGYLHQNVLFYAEKVLLAKEGEPPRLENIGLVYPPLAFLPFWFIDNYLLVSPFASAFMLTFFIQFLLRKSQESVHFQLIFLLLNPLVLFLATYRFDVLAFYLFFTVSVIMLIYHLESGYSLHLFLSGFLFGVCFFLDFRILLLLPLYILSIYLSIRERSFNYKLSLLIVKLSPVIFFLFTWLYLNWIFTEDPFNFIKSPYSFFKSEPLDTTVLSASGSFLNSLEYTALRLINYLPLILPYFLVFLKLRKYRTFYLMPTYFVYFSPILLITLSVYFSVFFPAYYYTVFFLLFTLTFQTSFRIRISKLILFAFILSLISSWTLPLSSKEENEKNFVKFLLTGEINKNLEEYKEVAKVLEKEKCQKILIDDAGGFPIVVFVGDPKRFYLPYMYEYYTVLSNPKISADCVVIDKIYPMEKIRTRFPKANMGFLKDYSLVYYGERYNIFKR